MRVEVIYKQPQLDGRCARLSAHLLPGGLAARAEHIAIADVYLIEGVPELTAGLVAELFSDPVAQDVVIDQSESLPEQVGGEFLFVEIAGRPGVTDPVAVTAKAAIEQGLSAPLPSGAFVQSARLYMFRFSALSEKEQAGLIASLHNPLIEQAFLLSARDYRSGTRLPQRYPHTVPASASEVEEIPLVGKSDSELEGLSKERLLALDLAEMRAVRDYYASPKVQALRRSRGLSLHATDVELEMIAQTWSEHCKHKIFNATIRYTEGGKTEEIHSLFQTYIKSTTDELAPSKGYLRSVFTDNSGVIEFDEEHLVCFKVETHNSPSALDPYGGAITGIVGVNRDILGTGKGAKPIFNTDVLCFGYPDTPAEEVGEGLLHPGRVLAGVHRGIVDGGNQSGIPVVGGAFLFDESFAGKPLVFCGTGGILPARIGGEGAWVKHVEPGDIAVMVGGRVGKDGIHGATFSSLALDETSPTSAVQIGDPITQKKMSDFLLEARDLLLYRGITDNGAGGLSSSLGEMARDSGGVRIDLDRCPLKYPGLAPWEILVSESQERMSLAVAPEKIDELLELARRRQVEATVVGAFTDSGLVEVTYDARTVGLLSLDFLHEGLPTMRLEASWPGPPAGSVPTSQAGSIGPAATSRQQHRPAVFDIAGAPADRGTVRETLLRILAEPNIASKEELVRQYDHEVQAKSVVKPFVGERSDGPSDGAVIRPVFSSDRGLTVTHGICPSYSTYDTYRMAMCAVDEAYRAHIALGGNPGLASALDNFCWPDPVQSDHTPDGAYKLAQLVRACRGMREACLAYGIPLISGKDSMKNDARFGGRKLSIKPTLLISLVGIIDDVRGAMTTDFKQAGDLVYLLGETRGELGGTSYERLKGEDLGPSPELGALVAKPLYEAFHRALSDRLVASAHDLSEGGLGVALAESALGGRLGATISLPSTAIEEVTRRAVGSIDAIEQFLYCETPSRLLVTIRRENRARFEGMLSGFPTLLLGEVTAEPALVVRAAGPAGRKEREVAVVSIEEIEKVWKRPQWSV